MSEVMSAQADYPTQLFTQGLSSLFLEKERLLLVEPWYYVAIAGDYVMVRTADERLLHFVIDDDGGVNDDGKIELKLSPFRRTVN